MNKREKGLIAQLGIHIDSLTSENERLRERLQAERDFRDKVNEKARGTYSINELLSGLFPDLLRVMDSSRGSVVLRSQDPLDNVFVFLDLEQN